MMRFAIASGILALSLISHPLATAQSFSNEFKQLQALLQQSGFSVRLERPPHAGTYGSLHTQTRTVWINPVVLELGIAEPTLVHEAVHAAQHCANLRTKPDANQLTPLGLKNLETPNFLRPYFLRYSGTRRHVEREAYAIQVREDRLIYVSQLLHQYCPQNTASSAQK